MSQATSPSSLQQQNCCFWIKHSESCASVRHAHTLILTALTAIALIGGTLLILSQQGFDLAGINSIAQIIEPKWVYGGMFIAGCIALVNTTFIIAQIYANLNKTISEEVLEKRGFFNWISNERIAEQLHPESYRMHTSQTDIHNPTLFSVIYNDADGNVSYKSYYSQEEALLYERYLIQNGYQSDENFPTYKEEYIESLLGTVEFNSLNQELRRDLDEGTIYYRSPPEPIMVNGIEAWPLAVYDGVELNVHYFRSKKLRENAIEGTYNNLWELDAINELGNNEYETQVQDIPDINQFWEFEGTLTKQNGTKHTIYFDATFDPDADLIIITHNFKIDDRTTCLQEWSSDATDLKAEFFKTPTFTEEKAKNLMSEDNFQAIADLSIAPKQFEKMDVPKEDLIPQSIYVLKTPQDIIYFKSDVERQKHIGENLKGFTNALLVRNQEEKNEASLIHKALEKEKDYWFLPIVENVVNVYYRVNGNLQNELLQKENLQDFLVEKGLEVDILQSINESGQLPEQMARELLPDHDLSEKRFSRISYLSTNEFGELFDTYTDSTRFPRIMVLAVKWPDKKEFLFFYSKMSLSQYCEQHKLTSAEDRIDKSYRRACTMLPFIHDEQKEIKKPILYYVKSPDGESYSLFNYPDTIEERIPSSELTAKLQAKEETHLIFDEAKLAKEPLTEKEFNYLRDELDRDTKEKGNLINLFAKQPVEIKDFHSHPIRGGYIAFLECTDIKENPIIKFYFGRDNDPKYLEILKGLGEQKK